MAKKSITKRLLAQRKRNREKLNRAIRQLSNIPVPGPAGRIVRAVAQAPEPITRLASGVFSNEFLLQAIVNEEIRRQQMIDANADARFPLDVSNAIAVVITRVR